MSISVAGKKLEKNKCSVCDQYNEDCAEHQSAETRLFCVRPCKEKSICVYLCRTVRIWDYTQDACINVLSGHKAPVRGLMWNTEVPFLLISGNASCSAL